MMHRPISGLQLHEEAAAELTGPCHQDPPVLMRRCQEKAVLQSASSVTCVAVVPGLQVDDGGDDDVLQQAWPASEFLRCTAPDVMFGGITRHGEDDSTATMSKMYVPEKGHVSATISATSSPPPASLHIARRVLLSSPAYAAQLFCGKRSIISKCRDGILVSCRTATQQQEIIACNKVQRPVLSVPGWGKGEKT